MSHRFGWTGALLLALLGTQANAATHEIQVISFRFEPAQLTIAPGDTVVWRNSGGGHNVVADDGSFNNGAVSSSAWTYSRTFNTAGEIGYYCQPHGGPGGSGMAGRITVTGGTPTPTFAIGLGISGTWYNPATSGQGFVLDAVPTINSLAVGWFTWSATTAGAYDWFSALGPINGDSATVELRRTSGGLFNDPRPVTSTPVGSATFKFTSCTQGTVTYNRTDIGQSGTIPIQRLTPVPTTCVAPTAN
jgi:plastocyanin